MNAIIAEDKEYLYWGLARLVAEFAGFDRVDHAVDGQDLIDKAREAYDAGEAYRLIISDLNMPRLGGLEALEAIRAFDPHVPFYLHSGHMTAEMQTRALALGANQAQDKDAGALIAYLSSTEF